MTPSNPRCPWEKNRERERQTDRQTQRQIQTKTETDDREKADEDKKCCVLFGSVTF